MGVGGRPFPSALSTACLPPSHFVPARIPEGGWILIEHEVLWLEEGLPLGSDLGDQLDAFLAVQVVDILEEIVERVCAIGFPLQSLLQPRDKLGPRQRTGHLRPECRLTATDLRDV